MKAEPLVVHMEELADTGYLHQSPHDAIIKEGIRDGSVRAVDPNLAVFTFIGAINWLPRWFIPGGRLPGKSVAEQMADLFLSGLTTDGRTQ